MKKRLLLFLLSVVVMFLTLSVFGIGDVIFVALSSNLSFVFLAVLCQLAIFLLYTVRFKIIASKYKNLSLKDSFFITTVGNFVSLVTPIAKIGGQPLMIYLTKERIGGAKSSAIVLTDTIMDILISVLLVAGVVIVLRDVIPYHLLILLSAFAFLSLIVTLGFLKLFLSKRILSRLLGWIVEKIRRIKKAEKIFHVRTFASSFRLVLADKKLMTAGMGISLLIKFFEMLRIWIIFAAIGINLAASTILIIWCVMLLLLLVPWLPGSLGLYEFGVSSALILLGVASSQAAGGVLLDRFVSFWFVILFSATVIFFSRHRLGEIMRMAEKR